MTVSIRLFRRWTPNCFNDYYYVHATALIARPSAKGLRGYTHEKDCYCEAVIMCIGFYDRNGGRARRAFQIADYDALVITRDAAITNWTSRAAECSFISIPRAFNGDRPFVELSCNWEHFSLPFSPLPEETCLIVTTQFLLVSQRLIHFNTRREHRAPRHSSLVSLSLSSFFKMPSRGRSLP